MMSPEPVQQYLFQSPLKTSKEINKEERLLIIKEIKIARNNQRRDRDGLRRNLKERKRCRRSSNPKIVFIY